MKFQLGITFINRVTGKEYATRIMPKGAVPSFRFKTDMLNFSDVFDFKIGLPKNETYDFGSHDFCEFFFIVNEQKIPIGVGYIEDFVDTEGVSQIIIATSGRDLMGRLVDVPFRKAIQVNELGLLDIYSRICSGEYVQRYAQIKGRKGYIKTNNHYTGKMLYAANSSQLKGRILQRYTNELALNVAYSDENGFINIRGRQEKPDVIKGTLSEDGESRNVSNISVSCKLSQAFSDAVILYNSTETNVADANKAGNPIENSDPRVKGIVNRRFLETINIGEAKDFAGNKDPLKRANEVAWNKIRVSNRELNMVSVTSHLPFVLEKNGEAIPFRLGDFWRLKSYRPKFRTKEHPEGEKEVVMLLAGVMYEITETGNVFELLFIEPDTVC